MKKAICILLIASFLGMYGCGDNKVINGKEYGTYGVFNKEEERDPNIKYRVIVGNLVWACLLFQTVILPVYFFGFSLWEPVGVKE